MIKLFTKKRKGFTLIELIVVIAILGVLMLIAVPRFTGTLNNAKKTADDATEKVIQSAVDLYRADNKTNPTNLAALSPNYLKSGTTWSNGTVITAITIDTDGTVSAITPARPVY